MEDEFYKVLLKDIKIREITEEDIILARYTILLFIRMYIESPPQDTDPKEQLVIDKFIEFLEMMHSNATIMEPEILEVLLEQALKASKVHDALANNDEDKEEDKIIN